MAENNKTYDWFASLVQNPDLMISDFKKLGVTPENSNFKSKSEYENLPQVKEAFKTNDGKFDKKAFDQFYDNALLLYNNYASEEYVPKANELFGYLDSEWDRPQGSKVIDTTPRFTISETAPVQSYGVDYINKNGQGAFGRQSAREIGQQQEVVDYQTGEGLGWTPDDKSGLAKALFRPTLVLASYDNDEYDENGALLHKKGDLKYNKDGLPYYETLGDRSISGKQVLAYSDSITRENSWLNKYDFFDSDGMDKNLFGTAVKTAVKVIPYLIPGVGEVVGGATAIIALNRVLPVLGKAIAGIAGGEGEDEFTKQMNKYEGWFAKFDPSVSDYSQEHVVSFENLGNLISSISGQLFQQRVVGSIPMLLNKSGDIVKQSEMGRTLAYGYMALTSAQDSFNTFKEAGASDSVAGWAFVANMLALGALMKTDYGKGLLFKGSWLDENVLREPAIQAANEVREELTKGIETATTKEKAKFIQKLVNIYNKHFSSMAADTFVNRGFSEALEEVMEEGIIDVQKALTSVAQSVGINVGEQKLDFGWSWKDAAQRYGMAAAGGFLGGGIFHLQGKWDQFLANDMAQHTDEDTLQKLTYYIAQGRGQEIRDLYAQWHNKGLLGSVSLGTNLSTVSSINGQEVVSEPVGNGLSQNDVVYNTLVNYVNSIEETISKEGLRIDVGTLTRDMLNGFKESDESLRGDTLINLGVHDLLIKDVYDVAAKIVQKTAELKSEINNLTVKQDSPDAKAQTEENIKNSETIKKLEKELNNLRTQRDSILNGDNNWKYVGQAIFASNTDLAKNFIDLSIENYSQVVLGRKYSTLNEEEKQALDERYAEYMRDSGKNKILRAFDVYMGMSKKYADRLRQDEQDLKDYSPKETIRPWTQFESSFVKKLKDYQDLIREYQAVISKENKTQEDIDKENEIKLKLEAMELSINQSGQNAFSMLIHPSEDNKEIVELLSKGLLTSDETGKAYNLIKQMYRKYSTNKVQLNNDYEYIALLRNTAADFINSANISKRVDAWLDVLETQTSQTADGIDPGLWTSWLDENGLYDLLWDEDNDQTNYDSEFLHGIKKLANEFIDNLGINNKVALNALNQIRITMSQKGFSSDIINDLLENIVPQYIENGQIKPVTKFIEEIDTYRANIKYSSFTDLLQDFASDLFGTRIELLDIFNQEKYKLAGSRSIEDYLIRNPEVINDLKELQSLIKVVRGVIIGTYDKTNSSINAANGDLKLAELSENTVKILYNQSYELEREIETLLKISEMNGFRTLRIHEDIDKHMRGKFIWTLINNPTFVENFGKKFYTVNKSGEQTPINIKKIADNILQGKIDLSKSDTADPNELLKFEVDFETAVYNAVTNSFIGEDNRKKAEAIVSLFEDAWKLNTTKLSVQTDTVTPYSLLTYLQLIISVPANSFYTQYEKVTQDESSRFAPIYNQEMALRHLVSEVANPELSNFVLEELSKRVDTSKVEKVGKEEDYRQTINWLTHLSILRNFVIIPGGAGCGKTTAVAENAAKMYNDYDHEYICLAPEDEQSENLAKAVGENIKHFNKATFFKEVFGVNLQTYQKNTKTGHQELAEIPVVNNNLFDNSKSLKMLFIDEVSLFTESELKLISDYAVNNGIIVIGLGDPVQNSAKVYTDLVLGEDNSVKREEQKTWHSSGLEDCIYFGSSYLTASLRPDNRAQFENFNILSEALDRVVQEWREKPWISFKDLDTYVPESITLKYFENSDIFYGANIVKNDVSLVDIAKNYAKRGQVTIITDDLSKYQNLPSEIKVRAYDKMQGMETDFALIDVDFNKNNSFGGVLSKYALVRDIYTLTQRSRVGTIIKNNGLPENFIKTENLPEVGHRMIMSDQDIAAFKQKRGEALSRLTKSDDFFDYVYKFIPNRNIVAEVKTNTEIATKTDTTISTENPSPKNDSSNSSVSNPVNNPVGTLPPGSNGTETPSAPINNSNPPSLPPSAPKPVNVQQSAKAANTSGSKLMMNSHFNTFVHDSNFIAFEQRIQNSIANWKLRNGGQNVNISDEIYVEMVSCLASTVRTGLQDQGNRLLEFILTRIRRENNTPETLTFLSNLKKTLFTIPEIYIQELEGDTRIVNAVYRNGNDFIQVPVGFVKGSPIGRYTGGFKRGKVIDFETRGLGKWRTLEQFKLEYPGIIFTDNWGALVNNYNDNNNKGKLFAPFTDEYVYQQFLSDWYEKSDTEYFKHWHDIRNAAIQKVVDPQKVLQYIVSLRGFKGDDSASIEELTARGLWIEPSQIVGELTGNDLDSVGEGSEYFKNINKRGYQVLPIERAIKFIRAGLQATLGTNDFDKMMANINIFMHTFFRPNDRIDDENHGLIMWKNDNEKYLVKTIFDDEKHIVGYRAIPYSDRNGYDEHDRNAKTFNYQTKFPFLKITQELFNTTDIPYVQPIRFIKKKGSSDFSPQTISANDSIYVVFGNSSYNMDQLVSKMLSDEDFLNGVYVNDVAGDLYPNSIYRKFTGNKNGYWIRGDIYGTQWYIDEGSIQPITSRTIPISEIVSDFKTLFDKIKSIIPETYKQEWVNKYSKAVDRIKAGEDPNVVLDYLINAINNNMAFTKESWIGTRLVKTGSGFKIEKYNNFSLWLDRTVKSLLKANGVEIDANTAINFENNQLETWNYATILLTLSNNVTQHGILTKTKSGEFKFNLMSDTSYQAYSELQNQIKVLGSELKPIQRYLNSIYSDLDGNALEATKWINDNIAVLGNFNRALNNYLQERILNNEC